MLITSGSQRVVSQLSTKFNEERIGLITDLLIQSPAHF